MSSYTTRGYSRHRGARGGGMRGRGWRYYPGGHSPQVPSHPSPPLGDLIKTITTADLGPVQSEQRHDEVKIRNVQHLSSYSWMDEIKPLMLVPGKPPVWTPPEATQKLKEDDPNAIYYRDQNAAHYPPHPIEPGILSILEMLPQKPSATPIDLVACASTLGNLLRFVRGSDKSFRMIVEVIGDTVHFQRRENAPREFINGVRGYGHAFPEAYTSWDTDVKGSYTHQRVISYDFAGLNTIMRFESDGYVCDRSKASTTERTKWTGGKSDVADLLASMSVDKKQPHPEYDGAELLVERGGGPVSHESLLDIKTRTIKRYNDPTIMEEELPRLWVRQLSKFVLAFHSSGSFRDVEVKDVREDISKWETEHQKELKLLPALLHYIMETVKELESSNCELVCPGDGNLEFRVKTDDAGEMLSETTRKKWEEWLATQGQIDSDSDGGGLLHADSDSDSDSDDFTACGGSCGYCGKCNK